MYRYFIIKGDDAQNLSIKVINFPPKTIAVPLLRLYSKWIFKNINTPLLFDVSPFSQNLVFKVWRKFIDSGHHFVFFKKSNPFTLL